MHGVILWSFKAWLPTGLQGRRATAKPGKSLEGASFWQVSNEEHHEFVVCAPWRGRYIEKSLQQVSTA